MPTAGAKSGGGGPGAGAIRAGSAFIEIFANDTKLTRVLNGLKSRLQAVGSLFTTAGAGLAAGGAAILAPIAGVFSEVIDRGTELKLVADQFGTTTEAVSSLAYAAETAGVDLQGFGDITKDLSAKITEAANGNDEAFRAMGLSAKALLGLPLDQQYGAIADALAGVEDPQKRVALAMQVMGEGGRKLVPILAKGSGELARLAGEARDVGAVMSGETAGQAAELGKTFAKTWSSIKYAILEVGVALLPQADTIAEYAASVRDVAKSAREWISENKGVVLAVTGLGAGLIAAGAALIGLGVASSAAAAGLGVLSGALGLVLSGVGALLSPVGLAVAAGVALGAGLIYLVAQTEQGAAGFELMGSAVRTVGQELKAGFADAVGIATQAWGGITNAIKAGRIDLAAEVGFKGLQLGWAKVVLYFQKKWNEFKGFFVDAWHDLWMLVEIGFVTFVGEIEKIWETMTTRIAQAFILAIKYAIDSQLAPIAKMLELVGADENAADVRGVTSGLGDAFNRLGAGLAGKLAKVDERVKDDQSKVIKDAQKAEAERLKARGDALAQAQAEVNQAEAQFAEVIANAAQAAADAGLARAFGGIGGKIGEMFGARPLPSPEAVRSSIQGTFATPFADRQFGRGSGDRLTKAAEKTAKNSEALQKLPQLQVAMERLAKALTFQ